MASDEHRDGITLVAVWGSRVAWLAAALLGGAAIGDALADRSRAVQLTGTVGSWAVWAVVALALLVPSTVSLTVARTIMPMSVVAAVVAAVAADGTLGRVAVVATTVLATALAFTGELGQRFAQGSAYGDERRFVLRAPVAFLIPTVVSWVVLCTAAIVGPLALAARGWLVGIPVTAAAGALGWFLGRRYHRLSRRWIVVVPAGVVVHDHLVLSETAMFPIATIERVGLALADTQAADLTGPAAGMALEVRLRNMPTVVLAPTRRGERGKALHVASALLAPTRPGRALAELARRGIPTG